MNITLIDELQSIFGKRLNLSQTFRNQFCQAPSGVELCPPDLVITVHSEEEIQLIIKLCSLHEIPVIPAGARSSLEGQINAPSGGICIDCSEMNEIIVVSDEDMTATIQPGVTREQLNDYLRHTGLFFPVDPGANASIGGMASTRASGTNSVRYGTMSSNVQSARVVTSDGQVVSVGSHAPKSAMGLDLLALMVGSEGTLGIFSELTVKLHPQPENIVSGVCSFKTVENAINTVTNSLSQGISLARIELLDTTAVKACNQYSKLNLPETPHLFLEFHGNKTANDTSVNSFIENAGYHGGVAQFSNIQEERSALWKARHDAWWAFHSYYKGCKGLATDVCVPLSHLSECIAETTNDIESSQLNAPLIGHVGDGNFHLLIMHKDEEDSAKIQNFLVRLSDRALSFNGTVSGEHGVGQGKRKWMAAQHGAALQLMKSVKSALDPKNILNPQKMF
uniref:D-lactate dehydrogenase (cytochrome) n=1 Tax=Marinomonas sp. (strain MWYL1) TaxID=400668 RepID=A6VRK7_MARMS